MPHKHVAIASSINIAQPTSMTSYFTSRPTSACFIRRPAGWASLLEMGQSIRIYSNILYSYYTGVLKRLVRSQFQFKNIKRQIGNYDLSILYKFGDIRSSNPTVYEGQNFNFWKSRHRSGVEWSQFSYVCQAATLLGIVAISTQFVSLLFARGDTVMPCGLHARLCHAFLVLKYLTHLLMSSL